MLAAKKQGPLLEPAPKVKLGLKRRLPCLAGTAMMEIPGISAKGYVAHPCSVLLLIAAAVTLLSCGLLMYHCAAS